VKVLKELKCSFPTTVKWYVFCYSVFSILSFLSLSITSGKTEETMALNDVTEDDCRLYRLFVIFKRLIDELKQN